METLHLLTRPTTWMIITLLILLWELYQALPLWAKLIIRPKLGSTKTRKNSYVSDELKERRRHDINSFGVSRQRTAKTETKETEELFVLLREMWTAVKEIWEKVTSDGVKPGFWDFIVLVRLLKLLQPIRAQARDERYQTEGTFIIDPAAYLKEQAIDMALDLASLAYEVSDFAVLKEGLGSKGFHLLRRDYNTAAGSASYYIATNQDVKNKVAYVAIKGSDSTADFLTNFCLRSSPYKLPGPFIKGGNTVMWSHEGHSLVAMKIVDNIELLIREFIIPAGYNVILVGHSLGGSLACACGMILRARLARQYPQILTDNGDIIKVVALAPAPFVNEEVAMQCKPFIVSVVNNSDAVPRWSINNLMMGVFFLKLVKSRMDELGGQAHFGLHYMRILLSSTPIMTIEDVEVGMDAAYEGMKLTDSVDNACIPGKVVILVDLWNKPGYNVQELLAGTEGYRCAEKVLLSDGMARVLRYIELDVRMSIDHTCGAYHSSLKALMEEHLETSSQTMGRKTRMSGDETEGYRDGSMGEFTLDNFNAGNVDMGVISARSLRELGLDKKDN